MNRKIGSTRIKSYQRLVRKVFLRSRKRIIRFGLLAANIALLIGVVGLVMRSPDSGQAIKQSASLSGSVETISPLDQLSSSDIAVHVARMASLPESTAVVNQADTISGQLASGLTDTVVVAKPQIVSTDAKSYLDIQQYVVVAGDTLASVARKFGVTSDSIRWSNDLSGTSLPVGRKLYIPPVNGIVYLVKSGDTADKLAREYNADKDAIVAFNDAEIRGLLPGSRIVIPDGTKQSSVYNVTAFGGGYSGGGTAWGPTAVYGYNGYAYGWCTWYVANKISVPANWGNANTWDNYAPSSGWTVSSVPRVGAIAQTDGMSYWGHVAYVEAISPDGSMIKYSDMNGIAGWGQVGYSGWVPVGTYPKYIYR